MTRRAMVIVALVLAMAAAATAATAFAGPKKKRILIEEQVAHSVQDVSQAMLQLKTRALRKIHRQPQVTLNANRLK